jgi:uncharacterized protein
VADGVLLARVAARPIDGAANVALVRLLAAELELASSRISLRMGARGRRKVVEIVGMSAESIRSRWPGIEV